MNFRTDDISINTFIGYGSAISGDLHGNGFVRIDGDVDGNFETSGSVIIGEKARIQGNVIAKVAIIGGIVLGDVTACDGVQLLATSTVIGDIATRHLQIEDKVIMHGHCISLEDKTSFDEKSAAYVEAKSVRSRVVH
mgnify:CR=1 FL=1